jgi:ferredoxin
MRIEVDRERCTGHGRCWTLAPDTFDADDDGYCATTSVEVDDADEAAVAAALRGVRSCPEHAIRATGQPV